MKFIFASLFLFIFALILFYAKNRFFDKINFSKSMKIVIFAFLIFIYFFVVLYFLNRFYDFLNPTFYYISSICIAFGFIVFVFALFYEIYKVVIKIFKPSKEFDKIVEFGIFYLMIGYLLLAVTSGFKEIKINHHEIESAKIKQNLKIIFLSDLHIGPLVDTKYVQNVVKIVNDANPDFVLLGGDILDDNLQNSKDELAELAKFKARFGVFYALGNHEYFYGEKESLEVFRSLGVQTLENSSFVFDELGVEIGGIYDFMGFRKASLEPDLSKFAATKNFNILISHQPKVINEPNFDLQKFDLVLSGHTHCGQIFPFGLLVLLQQPYLCGVHKLTPNSELIISSGVGFWGPKVRIGSDFEVLEIEIKSSQFKK